MKLSKVSKVKNNCKIAPVMSVQSHFWYFLFSQNTWLFFHQWWWCRRGGSWLQEGRQGHHQWGLGGIQTAEIPSQEDQDLNSRKFYLKKINIQTAENFISKRFVRFWVIQTTDIPFVRVQTCTYLQLIKPEGIDHVDDIEKEVSCQAGQNQRLSGESARTGFQCDQTRSHPKIFKLLRVIFNRKYSIESMRWRGRCQ